MAAQQNFHLKNSWDMSRNLTRQQVSNLYVILNEMNKKFEVSEGAGVLWGIRDSRYEESAAWLLCTEDTTLDDISRLAHPEHCVRFPRDAHRINVKAVWSLFSLLKFDVVRDNDVCKESLDLVDHEEATRADKEI